MFRLFKPGLGLGAVLALSACLEVEDKSNNSELTNTLREQNQILQQQNDLLQEDISPEVNVFGVIYDLETGETISGDDASLSVRVGAGELGEPVTLQDGEFLLESLPPASNIEILVRSQSGAFLDRVFYQTTRSVQSGVVFQDLGKLGVLSGKNYRFSVLNANTNEAVEDLEFRAYSHSGEGSSYTNYAHLSTYHSETEQYSIDLPAALSLSVTAIVDFNADGERDYFDLSPGHVSGTSLILSSSTLEDLQLSGSPVYVYPDPAQLPGVELNIRVSVVDGLLNPIEGLSLFISEPINEEVAAEYDDATSQYVMDAAMGSRVSILIPAFTVEDEKYRSESISISRYGESELQVRTIGTSGTFTYTVSADLDTLNIVVVPRVAPLDGPTELVLVSESVRPENNELKLFYSSPISLPAGSASLVQNDAMRVVRGNDSEDDLIIPGISLVELFERDLPVNSELSVGDTLLTLSAGTRLDHGYPYTYSVGTLIDQVSGEENDIYSDSITFYPKYTGAPFNINQLILDNNNYTSGGSLIQSRNTAGEIARASNSRKQVMLILPATIKSLKSLTLLKRIVTRDGVISADNQHYQINVQEQYSPSYSYMVSLAENETIIGDLYYRVNRGTSLPDGQYRTLGMSEYLSDDMDGSKNTITFEYSYETLTGEISNGELTLPVR